LVPGHSRIHGNEDADVLAREGLSSSLQSPKPAVSISPYVGKLKIKEWVIKKHFKH
jgi:hypothetical protein